MESAFTLANRELEEIRQKNKEQENIRHNEVLLKNPKLAELESELMKQGTRLLKCVLNHSDDFEDIKKSIQALQWSKTELLEKSGFSKDYLDDIHTCRKCHDTGFVEGRRCDCLKALIVKHIGANSNLTDHMRKQNFDNFDLSLFANQGDEGGRTLKCMQVACEKALSFAECFDKNGDNFLIMGNAGTGKTYLTSCVANHALKRGKTVYYQTAFKLFEILENHKFNKGDEESGDIVKYIYDVDLLIIDDLGTEFATQFTNAAFFDIINSRIISGKSTMISTNLGFEEISNGYSQRIASRFVESYQLIQTMGKDLRTILRERKKNI